MIVEIDLSFVWMQQKVTVTETFDTPQTSYKKILQLQLNTPGDDIAAR